MKSFAEIDLENNGNYLNLLSAVSKLSGLFSESAVPFINYRVAENIFCRSFNANNLSRSDTAFDADLNSVGIGLKTFISKNNNSTEKVAEFNSLSRDLKNYRGKDLALKLGEYRNERIDLANRVYDIKSSLYHIVARREKELLLFETDYNQIDIANIHSVKENKASLQLKEGELATIEKLNKLGFDSVIITKNKKGDFKIDIMRTNAYNEFLDLEENTL